MFSIKDTNYTWWDRIPLASTLYSGPVGITKGMIQVVDGVVRANLALTTGLFKGNTSWKKDLKVSVMSSVYGLRNLVRGMVALIPFVGNLAIIIYEKSPFGPYILERDSEGMYIVPRFSVPGFTNTATMSMREVQICVPDFTIDTAKGIVPDGWILRG